MSELSKFKGDLLPFCLQRPGGDAHLICKAVPYSKRLLDVEYIPFKRVLCSHCKLACLQATLPEYTCKLCSSYLIVKNQIALCAVMIAGTK